MKMYKIVLGGCLLAFVTACGSISVMVPAAQIESPDVPGKTKLQLGGGLIPGRDIHWSDDASKRPPTVDGSLDDTSDFVADVDVGAGLGRRFEVSGNIAGNFWDAGCAGLMGKFQLFGEPAISAQQGDFPVAVFAHWEGCASYRDGNQNGDFGDGGNSWRANANSNTGDIGLSAGYRFTNHGMVYAGGSYGFVATSLTIHQDASDDQTSAGGDYSGNHTGDAATGALGLKFEWTHFSFEVKAAYTHITLAGANPDALTGAGHFGFRF